MGRKKTLGIVVTAVVIGLLMSFELGVVADLDAHAPVQFIGTIESGEIYTLLTNEFGGSTIYMSDDRYNVVTTEDMVSFLDRDKTNERTYVPEVYDCENFAFTLISNLSVSEWNGIMVGIAFMARENDTNHACNLFVDNEMGVWFIEAETDAVFKMPEGWDPYLIVL